MHLILCLRDDLKEGSSPQHSPLQLKEMLFLKFQSLLVGQSSFSSNLLALAEAPGEFPNSTASEY